MDNKKKKMIAPIIVTIVIVVYYIAYFGLLFALLSGAWRYLLGIVPLILSIIMVKVCLERIKEIKEGEENDITDTLTVETREVL